MENKNKMVLIGWDAADWKVINPLLDQGLMPNLKRMVNNGTMGNLATMDPAYSPMLWTSIATGKHAYKHGVHGFLQVSEDEKSLRPVLSTSRKVRAIWEILSEQDLKTHVVGWWPSHPAEPMNGISISNFYQKPAGGGNPREVLAGSVHPPEMHERFANLKITADEMTGQHMLPFVPLGDRIDQAKDNSLLKIANETAMAATLQAAFTNIIRNEEWDFAAVYFDTIDHYCHGWMKFHPPKQDHIPQHLFDIYKDVVTAGYRFHDMMLGRILDLIDDDTTVMLISDHGFQPDHLRPKSIPKEPGGPAYEHSPYGVIAMMGPNIKKDHLIHGATLLDICPTILAHFDQPIGKDMDGLVLSDVFSNPVNISEIESWEDVAFNKYDRSKVAEALDADEEKIMIDQLVALGYVEPMSEDKTQAIKENDSFNKYNLAKSYLFAGKLNEATAILKVLIEDHPKAPRYKYHLATCYQGLGKLSDCRALITELKEKKYYNPIALNMMDATLMIGERNYKGALEILIEVEKVIGNTEVAVYAKIARCYMYLGNRRQAQIAIDKGLAVDFENHALHHLQGILLYHNGNNDDAIQSLLTAIGLEFNNASCHRYLGMSLYNLGKYEEAASAMEICLQLNPTNNSARSNLIDIYKIHLDKPQKAAAHQQLYASVVQGEVVVVSGLPRSGTSMMMQMLDAAGLEIYTDKKRNADDSNPKGYYEHESVKTINLNRKWVKECQGKVVKVVSNLLPALPLTQHYKVIMMDRDLSEVFASQRRMLGKLGNQVKEEVYPLKVMKAWEASAKVAKEWASKHAHVELLVIKYSDVIERPFEQAILIAEFLGKDISPEKMVQSVDPKLYRERTLTNV